VLVDYITDTSGRKLPEDLNTLLIASAKCSTISAELYPKSFEVKDFYLIIAWFLQPDSKYLYSITTCRSFIAAFGSQINFCEGQPLPSLDSIALFDCLNDALDIRVAQTILTASDLLGDVAQREVPTHTLSISLLRVAVAGASRKS
jgi:hypothetical protein